MTPDLKPCPFCGAKARITRNRNRHPNDGEWDVECENCEGEMRRCSTPESAAKAWNTRVPIQTASTPGDGGAKWSAMPTKGERVLPPQSFQGQHP